MKCPTCGKEITKIRCGHCGSQLENWQSLLYSAVAKKLNTTPPNELQPQAATLRGGVPVKARPAKPGHYDWQLDEQDKSLLVYLATIRHEITSYSVPESKKDVKELVSEIDRLTEILSNIREEVTG